MPETATSVLDALPRADVLDPVVGQLGDALQVNTPSLGVAELGSGLVSQVRDRVPAVTIPLPDMSQAPSMAEFRRGLDGNLAQLTAVDGRSLLGSAKGALPVEIPRPDFGEQLNTAVTGITSQVLPAEAVRPIPADVPGLGSIGDFTDPLRRLAEAGAATPLRMLQAILAVLDRFVLTISDADRLKELTAEALSDILIAQAEALRDALPLSALDQADPATAADFLDGFERLLADLGRLQDGSGPELVTVLHTGEEVLARLRQHRAAAAALDTLHLADADPAAPVRRAIQAVVGFGADEEPFLRAPLTRAESQIGDVLDAIGGPVQQFTGMLGQVHDFLEAAAGQAEQAARAVSGKLETTLQGVSARLGELRAFIDRLRQKITEFIGKVAEAVATAMGTFKAALSQVVDAVDGVFTRVEEIRARLDETVAQLARQVETRFQEAVTTVEQQIRQLLSTILAVLDREEVQQVLDQARQGVEKLRTTIEEASLQSVFDLVVGKTSELEGKVQAIDTSRLGTPQKTALKVGVKVIQQVKVEEVVRPELEAAFAQILEPLRELILLLEDKVLVIEREIDRFRPGTLLTTKIDPVLAPVFRQLDELRPSTLLQPLRDALAELGAILDKLDPQQILDEVQGVYGQLYELVQSLEPTALNAQISRATGTAVNQLTDVRDVYLERILETIRETVSLNRLLEGTGIQELADAEIFVRLQKVLGGEYLTTITDAVSQVQARLDAEFGALNYRDAARVVALASTDVGRQIEMTAKLFSARAQEAQDQLAAVEARVRELDQRRREILQLPPARPEVAELLRRLDPAPVLELLASTRAVLQTTPQALNGKLTRIRNALEEEGRADALAAIREADIRKTVPKLFRSQVAVPVQEFVDALRARLQVFAQAVQAIRDFLDQTLRELPQRIDGAVAGILGTLRENLQRVITDVIAAIGTATRALTGTISEVYALVDGTVQQINPAWVLNSFGADDLTPAGADALARRLAAPEGDRVALLLFAKLDDTTRPLVTGRQGNYAAALRGALNAALSDLELAGLADDAASRLAADQASIEGELAKPDLPLAERVAWQKRGTRNKALRRQLEAARQAYRATAPHTRFRLNRVVLEIQYPDNLKMGLQALHPYVVAQVLSLYPEQAVRTLDETYLRILGTAKGLPDRLIRAPLDEAFDAVKTRLHEAFDIQSLFRVLNLKLAGMEDDLSGGLDRLELAYNRLLTVLDQRLSA